MKSRGLGAGWRGVLQAAPFALFVLAPGAGHAEVTIQEVGLQGWFSDEAPARVRLLVSNPRPKAETFDVRVVVSQESSPLSRRIGLDDRVPLRDRFRLHLRLGPGQAREIDVPVLLGFERAVEATMTDPRGTELGRSRRLLAARATPRLMALLCMREPVCQAIQSRISFGGTDEDRVWKRRSLRFEVVRDPPATWWAYSGVDTVVVAREAASLSPAQVDALEGFVRHGGRAVVVEGLAGAELLPAYRRAGASSTPQRPGAGRWYRVAALADPRFDEVFAASALQATPWPRFIGAEPGQDTELNWARVRLVPSPPLPSLGWLLAWMVTYIVVVGVVNYGVLRRWGRPEWGWLSVPVVALVFSGGVWAASAAQRPRQLGIDETSVVWMDDRSPLAAVETDVLVSAPRRATPTLTLPGEAVLVGPQSSSARDAIPALGVLPGPRGWDVEVGDRMRLPLEVAEASTTEARFRALRRLAGSVRHEGGRLRNETGQDFVQAVYVDQGWVYFLGALKAAGEIEVMAARREPISTYLGRRRSMAERLADVDRTRSPFALVELIQGWRHDDGRIFEGRSGIFLGLAQAPGLGAELSEAFARRSWMVMIVSFGERP